MRSRVKRTFYLRTVQRFYTPIHTYNDTVLLLLLLRCGYYAHGNENHVLEKS